MADRLVSTVPLVCEALVTKLAAALPDWQVEWGRPQDSLTQRKMVYVADVDGTSRIPTMKAGPKERDETYSVDVLFVSAPARGTRSSAANDVLAAYGALDEALADDPTLGITDGVQWARIGDWSLRPTPTSEAAAAVLTTTVSVRARLV